MHAGEAVDEREDAVAGHLDDRRGRPDDRLDRAGRYEDVEEREGGGGLRAVEAQYVGAGEGEQAGKRHDQRRRDAAGETVERADGGGGGMGLGWRERKRTRLNPSP